MFSFNLERLRSSTPASSNQSAQIVRLVETVRTDSFVISRYPCELPQLKTDETICYGSLDSATEKAVLVTSERILIYNYKSGDIHPIFIEFSYEKNEQGILPQVKLFPNSTNNDTSVVIVDSVTGQIRYIESLSLAPSLDIFDGVQTTTVKLSGSEIVTIVEYFAGVGLVIATSNRRVLTLSVNDHLGKTRFVVNDVYAPKSLMNMFLGLTSHTAASYENANKVIAIDCKNRNTVTRQLCIQEEDGKLIIADWVNGSINICSQYNLKALLAEQIVDSENLKIKDIKLMRNNDYVVLTSCQGNTGKRLQISMVRIENNPSVIYVHEITSINTTDNFPKLSVTNEIASIITESSIIMTDTESGINDRWEDFINFNQDITVYGHDTDEHGHITLLTEKGIYQIKVEKMGGKFASVEFLKNHIRQALQYSGSLNLLDFNLSNLKLAVSSEDIESAVIGIAQEIASNEFSDPDDLTYLQANLHKRADRLKKLGHFCNENFDLQEVTWIQLMKYVEEIELSSALYEKLSDSEPLKLIAEKLVRKNTRYKSLDEFFKDSTPSVIGFLGLLVATTDLQDPADLLLFGEMLADVLNKGFLEIEINETRSSNIFQGEREFLSSVNEILRNLTITYADSLEAAEETKLKTRVSKIVLTLALFLYYVEITVDGELLAKNREGWVRLFVVLGQQEKIIKLAEENNDLESLCEILDSEREQASEGDALVAFKFEECFQRYGYRFAEVLFGFYARTRKIRLILNYIPQYPDYVRMFLNSSIYNYKFAWILDVENDEYFKAAEKLIAYVSTAESEEIEKKKFELNIAKLSLIALNEDHDNLLDEIEINLQMIELQSNYARLIDSKNKDGFIQDSRYLVDNKFTHFESQIGDIVAKMDKQQQLGLFEMVQLLTLVTFDEFSHNNFTNLFKLLTAIKSSNPSRVISNLSGYSHYHEILETLIWKRLFLTTDWDGLLNGSDVHTNEYFKMMTGLSTLKIEPPSKVQDLMIHPDDINHLEIDKGLRDDLLKENDLLSELNNKINLEQWLDRLK
ncbi:hypothetical protein KL905_002852 [Ogataea polymorpha]|nr:hypothetical protein KL937_002410 [Ogataea polymorpha]KAG7921394.1 hypothetical protein KL905_002852 [Ogataea polymorpha]KAG7935235.1 hypothetical protein KL904_002928 [Ogataea polymorpha]